jgi:hypothetical protein
LDIVETMNPPDSLMLQAGRVKINVESSGFGSVLRATIPVKVGNRWGDWTTTITDESSW